MVTTCPGKMWFGSGICKFAPTRAARVTPNLAAMVLNVSPERTTYFAIIGSLLDGVGYRVLSRRRGSSRATDAMTRATDAMIIYDVLRAPDSRQVADRRRNLPTLPPLRYEQDGKVRRHLEIGALRRRRASTAATEGRLDVDSVSRQHRQPRGLPNVSRSTTDLTYVQLRT